MSYIYFRRRDGRGTGIGKEDGGTLNKLREYASVTENEPKMTEVAEARIQDANKRLEDESKRAQNLERVTGHVKILVDVLDAASSVCISQPMIVFELNGSSFLVRPLSFRRWRGEDCEAGTRGTALSLRNEKND